MRISRSGKSEFLSQVLAQIQLDDFDTQVQPEEVYEEPQVAEPVDLDGTWDRLIQSVTAAMRAGQNLDPSEIVDDLMAVKSAYDETRSTGEPTI